MDFPSDYDSTKATSNNTDCDEIKQYYINIKDFYCNMSQSNTFDDLTNDKDVFDTTGMFFWCEEQLIENVILDKSHRNEFVNHIVCCIFADVSSPLIGLRSFVLPLRASNYFYEELKPIVFVGDTGFLKKEWKSICNFPKIYIAEVDSKMRIYWSDFSTFFNFSLKGSPNSRTLLRSVNIQNSDMCVIISSLDCDSKDKCLSDKSAILCSLNIKAMNFNDSIGLLSRSHNILPPGMAPLDTAYERIDVKSGHHVSIITELSKKKRDFL
jgi:potassium large conductance calcium-activated channel subfamily M alpha protein 1